MAQRFEDKLQQLSKKIQTINRPSSIIQRQAKCKDHLLIAKRVVHDRLEAIDNSLTLIEEKINKYQAKIDSTKSTIQNFSTSKHQKLRQIIEEWVDAFKYKWNKTKQSLKSYQTAANIKIAQIEKDNAAVLQSLRQKIKKNLKKINASMDNMQIKLKQQRQTILKQFSINKLNIEKLQIERVRKAQQWQKVLSDRFVEIQLKIRTKMQLLNQKWVKKDERTRKIMQILIQDDL